MGIKQTSKILGAMERGKYTNGDGDLLHTAKKVSVFVKEMALQQTKCSHVKPTEKCAFFGERAQGLLIKRIAHRQASPFLDELDTNMQRIRNSSLWDPYYEDGLVKALDKVYDINGLKRLVKRTKAIADVV